MDNTDAELKERIGILNRIYTEYQIPLEFYGRLKAAINNNCNKEIEDENHLVESLPH